MHSGIEMALNRVIRPYLQADGGDVELVGITGGLISLRFLGACVGCPRSEDTLRHSIEPILKKHLPEITGVVRA